MDNEDVRTFWQSGPPGQRYGDAETDREFFENISDARYTRQPYIHDFASFSDHCNDRVLEIGIGDGSDFQ
jgi:hypothetical protein